MDFRIADPYPSIVLVHPVEKVSLLDSDLQLARHDRSNDPYIFNLIGRWVSINFDEKKLVGEHRYILDDILRDFVYRGL